MFTYSTVQCNIVRNKTLTFDRIMTNILVFLCLFDKVILPVDIIDIFYIVKNDNIYNM